MIIGTIQYGFLLPFFSLCYVSNKQYSHFARSPVPVLRVTVSEHRQKMATAQVTMVVHKKEMSVAYSVIARLSIV